MQSLVRPFNKILLKNDLHKLIFVYLLYVYSKVSMYLHSFANLQNNSSSCHENSPSITGLGRYEANPYFVR